MRELQRTTGATIKLPEDIALNQQVQTDQPTAQNEDETDEENTSVNNSQLSPTVTQAPITALNEQVTTPVAETNGTAESDEAKEVTASPTANVTPTASNVVVVRIFGTFQASQLAQRRIQSLVMQSLRGYSTNDAILMNQRTLTNITNHHAFQMPPFMNSYHHHQGPHPHQHQQHHQQQHHHQQQRNDYQIQHQPRLNGQNVYNNNRRNNRQQQNKPDVKSETNGSVTPIQNGTTLSTSEQLQQQPVQQTA